MSQETFEFSCTVEYVTDAAVLVNEGDEDIWIPLSQVENMERSNLYKAKQLGTCIELEIPMWLATEKNIAM